MKIIYNVLFKKILFIGLFLVVSCSDRDDRNAFLQIREFPERSEDFSLWQLEQFNGQVQMAYIIKTDDNNIIVVDGGLATSTDILEDYLIQLGGEVHTWLTTHPHKDHIGALSKIISRGEIRINRIIHTAIDLEKIKLAEPNSYELVKDYYKVLENSIIKILDVAPGDNYSLGQGVELKILGNRNDKILTNLVNNSSLVFKISSKSKTILFLGDLGVEGGNVILDRVGVQELKTDYVQMAHHGQDGVSRSFYEAINPKYALWPTPIWLWENNLDAKGYNSGKWKTLIVRKWVEGLRIKKNYVSGIEGTIQID